MPILSLFILPFLFSASTIDPALPPRFLAWSLLNFALLIRINFQEKQQDFSMMRRAVFPILICYICISLLSLTKAVNLVEGIFECLKLFLFSASLYINSLLTDEREHGIVIVTKAMTVTGMMQAVMGLCQYYGIAFMFIPGNFGICGTMAHKNLFASALLLTLPFILYGISRFSGFWKITAMMSLLLTGAAIVLSRTKSVWGAMILAGTAVSFIALRGRKRSIIAAMCLILLAFLYYYTYSVSSFASLNERILLWKKSFAMIKENPLLGVGPGQWKILLPKYGRIEKELPEPDGTRSEVWFQRPHNDYIWVLSETGISGFICYLSVFLTIFFYIFKLLSHAENRDAKIFALSMLFGITGYMVNAFFCFPKERIVHNVFLTLIMSCILSEYHRKFKINTIKNKLLFRNQNLILLTLLIFCIVFSYARLNAEIHVQRALEARKIGDWQRVLSETAQADSRCYNMDPASTPVSFYRGVANFSLGRMSAALDDFKNAYQVHPYHIHVLNNLGTCYALSGDNEKAAEFYRKALAVSPQFRDAIVNLEKIGRK
jgi:O-antigen ligase